MFRLFKMVAALGMLSAAIFSAPAFAAELTAADRAWIDTCISQRKGAREDPARLRRYCTCMQATVDDNQPFDGITDLERTYPPAHLMCWRQARRR